MTERRLYLGAVEWTSVDGEHSIARLRPSYLYEEGHEMLGWYSLTSDEVRQQFPNRGLVSWFGPPKEAMKGSVWQFRVEEQNFDRDNQRHDAFKALPTPLQLEEVLDLRSAGNEERARLRLTQEGVLLDFVPSERIYLWVKDQSWIGPVHLAQLQKNNLWMLDPKEQDKPLRCIVPPPTDDIVCLYETRLFLVPGAKIGSRIGQVDWAADEVVLNRVLHWLRRTDPDYTDTLGLTSKAIDRVVEKLDIDKGTGIDVSLEAQRLQRACTVLAQLEERQELLEELITNLIHVPSIAAKIDEAADIACQRAETQVRDEATDLTKEVAGLKRKITDQRTELADIEERIDKRRAILTAQINTLETTLAERLTEIMARPEQILSDIAILRAVLDPSSVSRRRIPHAGGVLSENAYEQVPPPWIHVETKLDTLNNLEDLRRVLRNTFQIRGVPLRAAQSLHAAFLAGAMPILVGSNSFDALEAYASCTTRGRWLWLPISPTILEPSDLIGKVDPITRHFIPHPSGLLDLLLHARNNNDLYLVILDGLNRAAVDTYLAPILACYTDIWRSRQSRTLPLFHQHAVAPDDPYACITQVVWPSNVLLAGILTEGVTAIPPSMTFWSSATLLHLDQFDEDTIRVASLELCPTELSAATSISLETWRLWREQVSVADRSPCVELLNAVLAAGLLLRSEARMLCTQLYTAMQTWGDNERRALEDVIVQCLTPVAVASRQTNLLLEVLKSTQWIPERIEGIIRLTEQVVS